MATEPDLSTAAGVVPTQTKNARCGGQVGARLTRSANCQIWARSLHINKQVTFSLALSMICHHDG